MLLPLQLPTLLQHLLLQVMRNTAKATHRAMAWLMAMGQVEATHRVVHILVPTLKGAQQHHYVILQGILAMVTTGLLNQLVSRLLLMVPMSSKVIPLVPIHRLNELKTEPELRQKMGKPPCGILGSNEQWENSSAHFEGFCKMGRHRH